MRTPLSLPPLDWVGLYGFKHKGYGNLTMIGRYVLVNMDMVVLLFAQTSHGHIDFWLQGQPSVVWDTYLAPPHGYAIATFGR